MNKYWAMMCGYSEKEAELFCEFQESDCSLYELIGIEEEGYEC